MCYWGRSRDREDLDLNQTWSPPPFLLPKTIKSLRKTQKSPIFPNFVCLSDKAKAKWLLESQDQSLKLFWSLFILLQASAQKSMKLQLIFIPNGNGKVRELWCIDIKYTNIWFQIFPLFPIFPIRFPIQNFIQGYSENGCIDWWQSRCPQLLSRVEMRL